MGLAPPPPVWASPRPPGNLPPETPTHGGIATPTLKRLICTHDCPDACAIVATVDDGVAVDVRANPRHPVTGRHLCAKVDRYLDRVYSPDRLLHPLRRTGPKGSGRFVETSWDDALDTIAERLSAVIAESGPEAVLPYSYLGSMGVLTAYGPMHAFFHRLGASRLERRICGGARTGLAELNGSPWTDPERVADARLLLVWGMNPVSTSIHTWDLIRKARRRGATLVVIDPYRSRTAVRADLHLRLRPGTDGALALGMAHVILDEGLEDADYVDRHTAGVEGLERAARPWTPGATEEVTGIPADRVVDLARRYATTRPALIRYGVGMQRARGAGFALQAMWCLPALTGQWRHPAGGVADARSMMELNLSRLMETDRAGPAPRLLNMIRLGRILTDPALAPPVRVLFVWNSNPAVVAADQNRVLEGLSRENLFCVVHEQFLTDTARFADVVLPATTMLENEDVVGSWGFNYIGLSEAAVAPRGEAVSNSELARRLAARFGYDDEVFRLTDGELIDWALSGSAAERAGATRERLEAEGFVRMGAPADVAPYAEGGFPGPTGKWEFTSRAFAEAGLSPIPVYVPPAESPETAPELAARFPLRLLTLKRHFSINSSYAALPVMRGAEPEPLVELHPDDATRRGIAHGVLVRVWNDRGTVTARSRLTDDVPPGTVAVPFGRWLRDGLGANALTSDRLSDIGNGPTFCDALVEVAPADPRRSPVASSRGQA